MFHLIVRRWPCVLAVALLLAAAVTVGTVAPAGPGRPYADPGQVGCCSRGR